MRLVHVGAIAGLGFSLLPAITWALVSICSIEGTAGGKLKVLSIRDPQAREWLEQAYYAG